MIVILRRIAKNAKDQEIIDFLEPALKGNLFKKTGQIESIRRLILKDNRRKTIEYHALVTIDSEVVAKRVIKKLHRKPFLNRVIIIREYFCRSWHNDPRVNMHQWNEELVNKRKGSRRRRRLEVVNEESIKFSQGEDDFRTL